MFDKTKRKVDEQIRQPIRGAMVVALMALLMAGIALFVAVNR